MIKLSKSKQAQSRIISSYSMNPSLYKKLKAILDREGKSMNAFINQFAEIYVEISEKALPAEEFVQDLLARFRSLTS